MLFQLSYLIATAAAATVTYVEPKDLRVDDSASILGVARTLAGGVMDYYPGNATTFADLPKPYYWWECGSLFGAMLDYSNYTGDTTYDETIATAIMAQVGPKYDFIVPERAIQEGNDDQAFWGFTALTAAERNFPQPPALTPRGMPSWLDLSVNLWNNMVARWNTTDCGGGFTWQIYADNPNGINYKNTDANGGFFQVSARLARLTGNQTYLDWATKVWDWTVDIGLIDKAYNVYDGTDAATNCSKINQLSFSYQNGIYLYGAAVLANHTGSDQWRQRAEGLLSATQAFFTLKNATNIMWEHACEGVNMCDTDMKSFKGVLSRFLYASAAMLPSLAPTVHKYLGTSAVAAGMACTGDSIDGAPTPSGSTCGQRWYVGGFDGSVGLGQQMSAMETVHGLVMLDVLMNGGPSPMPSRGVSSPGPQASERSSAASAYLDLRCAILSLACGIFVWGMV